ncbi:MAG TPA: hypothetical protein VGQ57_05570, partial [Polyangiaceae bacterium]|nr:hypothetical protein [Polyangiaceae bacterium]
MRASFFVRSLRWVIGVALLGTAVPSCARSGLFVFGACEEESAERDCDDPCGTGTQTCADGTWSECTAPVTTRACQNDCGTGAQSCESHAWGECEVPAAERECSDICGTGSERCTDGSWGTCEVLPVDFPCDNACGDGLQHCEQGKLSRCDVPVAERACESACGSGHERCVGGAFQPCDAPQPNPPVLKAVLRDFSPLISPDFEWDLMGMLGDDPKIVEDLLGPDEKPVWSGDPSIHTVTSQATFDTWYRDVPGINRRVDYDLSLTASLTE